jgi:hypothetical protein
MIVRSILIFVSYSYRPYRMENRQFQKCHDKRNDGFHHINETRSGTCPDRSSHPPEGPGLQETKCEVWDCKVRDYREFCAIPDLIRDHITSE